MQQGINAAAATNRHQICDSKDRQQQRGSRLSLISDFSRNAGRQQRRSDGLGVSVRGSGYDEDQDLSQKRIPRGAGNHQQAPRASALAAPPFETPAIHPSGGLAGDAHAETTDIFQNTEYAQMQQITKLAEKR